MSAAKSQANVEEVLRERNWLVLLWKIKVAEVSDEYASGTLRMPPAPVCCPLFKELLNLVVLFILIIGQAIQI